MPSHRPHILHVCLSASAASAGNGDARKIGVTSSRSMALTLRLRHLAVALGVLFDETMSEASAIVAALITKLGISFTGIPRCGFNRRLKVTARALWPNVALTALQTQNGG